MVYKSAGELALFVISLGKGGANIGQGDQNFGGKTLSHYVITKCYCRTN